MALTQISTAGVKDDAVTSGKIPANAVGSSELADNAVDTAAIVDDAVNNDKIANSAVNTNQLADSAVHTQKINDDAVTTAKLANSIVNDINANSAKASITLNNNADNRVITGSGTANTLEGEANLTFTSDVLQVSSTTQGLGAKYINTGNEYTNLQFSAARTSAGAALGIINAKWNNNHEVAAIYLTAGDDTTNKDDGKIRFYTSAASGSISEGMQIDSSGNCLASKSFVSKKSNDASVDTSTASGFTADTFNVVLDQDVLEGGSAYLITFDWDHQGSGQPYLSHGSFVFQPGSTNPGSAGAMGPNHVPLQGAHTEQGVSKYWTFRYYSSTGSHVHGLQAAFNQNLTDSNGQGRIKVTAVKLADTTTI